MKAFFFIGKNYLKFFLIIFLGLEFFFIGADTIKYADKLPDSANFLILFFVYDALYALNYTLPLSLILGSILFYVSFLKTSQLSALLALGYSRRKILSPVLFLSLSITLGYIGLNTTPFVYAQEKAEVIVNKNALQNAQEDIFVKYNDDYVYFQKVFPLLNKAEGLKVFELRNGKLTTFIQSDKAIFSGGYWVLENAQIIGIDNHRFSYNEDILTQKKLKELKILRNFRPKVLDTFSKDRPTVSIIDAITSAKILISQKLDFEKVRAILYSFILIPLFVPLCIIIIASYIPSLARYGNLALLTFGLVILSLVIWGIFFSISKFSIGGIIHPEIGVLIPFGILLFYALLRYFRINSYQ
ncbi:LptF/LptG family permease [Helicobacter cholecystus]|uniref:LptF/LptG family permease n=1 Tax=Helicobacter cholecystus TaxID=45498 RepID=UPI0027396C6D|nr:LptF/LptG family permease [Helicobacter cholecystus]